MKFFGKQGRNSLNGKKDYNISIEFSEPIEDEKEITVLGNDHLLKNSHPQPDG